MPDIIIACSPGCRLDCEEQLIRIREQNTSKDIMVDVAIIKSIRKLMEHCTRVPAYMLFGTLVSFTGMPEIDFWYGSDEVLYVYVDHLVKACRDSNVPCTLHVGEGMCHCYPKCEFLLE